MDPNQALENMRAGLRKAGNAMSDGEWRDGAEQAMLAAEALDEWLSKGGFLPADWLDAQDKP